MHQPLSNPRDMRVTLAEPSWTGESHFRVRNKRGASLPVGEEVHVRQGSPEKPEGVEPESMTRLVREEQMVEEPMHEHIVEANVPVQSPSESQYGPVRASRIRQHGKGPPTFWLRPPEMLQDDVRDVLMEPNGVTHLTKGKSNQTRTVEQKMPMSVSWLTLCKINVRHWRCLWQIS